MDVVKTDQGYISGTILGEPGREVHVYRGIPYAAPPTGDLRWRPPQPVVPWEGIRECTAFSKIAPQGSTIMPGAVTSRPPPDPRFLATQSENCLTVNVLTPAKKANEALPVMVWMHGGGFVFGSGNDLIFNNWRLPAHGVVLVNVNMRLGPIGLLAHPLLSKESADGVSGNYLFLDMIAALKWVQRNIAAFGGNPDNVTIFGESGGSAKVLTLMASPMTMGLFRRVIGESGSPGGRTLKELEETGEKFFTKLGVSGDKDPLKAARAIPWEKIMEAEQGLIAETRATGRGGLWDIAIDGWFMPEKPVDIFKAGKQHRLDFILGANKGEIRGGPGAYLLPSYVELFSGAKVTGNKAYAYIFDQVPSNWKKDGCPAVHALELPYVFGDWDNKTGFLTWMLGSIAGMGGAKSKDPGLTADDKAVAEQMMAMWSQFAKTGDPNVKGMSDWPVFEPAAEKYLYISVKSEARTGFSKVTSK